MMSQNKPFYLAWLKKYNAAVCVIVVVNHHSSSRVL
jgi:hypothetical protein